MGIFIFYVYKMAVNIPFNSLLAIIDECTPDQKKTIVNRLGGIKEKKEKKEKKTDGDAGEVKSSPKQTAWVAEINKVREEMKTTNPNATFGEAMAEASRRRRAVDPKPAETQYREKKEKPPSDQTEPDSSPEKNIYEYLLKLQDSGTCNMLASGIYLKDRFGLSSDDCEKYVIEYVTNYDAIKKKYDHSAS
jgi:hypothetical protein